MDETPLFFDSHGRQLFGVLHQAGTAIERPAFVFCHPLAEEKLWAHRVFVAYARTLASMGYPVLRFDMTGNGDSGGEFSDLSLPIACEDVQSAMDEVRRRTGATAVSLLGLRFGATVAAQVAERSPDVRHLVQWAPITEGERYMQELLRLNVMTQMATYKQVRQERPELVEEMRQGRTVNVDGYEMAWPLYSSMAEVSTASARHAYPGPCLIVQIDRQPRPAADLQRLGDSCPGGHRDLRPGRRVLEGDRPLLPAGDEPLRRDDGLAGRALIVRPA
ncbi:MAG: alpha/beta hydrolase [Vicinamibacterales bacterium]